jgi:hypothetical protein
MQDCRRQYAYAVSVQDATTYKRTHWRSKAMSDTLITNVTFSGTIRMIEKGFIQITPHFGFWLNPDHYTYIMHHYKIGDSITLVSDVTTGFITEIKGKLK